MFSYSEGKLVLTESSIRSLDELFGHISAFKFEGDLLVDFLEMKSYVSEIVDKLNSGN